jgi:GTP-binding protein
VGEDPAGVARAPDGGGVAAGDGQAPPAGGLAGGEVPPGETPTGPDQSGVAGDGGRATTVGARDEAAHILSVAIVGRPNVGKSTLFNRLIGEERSVVHDLPGTTRDAVDTVVETTDGPIRFVDTAGLRRRAKEAEGAEYYSLVRALQAIDRAEAALFVIDATEGVTHQDQRLAERVDAAGNPMVICLNKWELLNADRRAAVLDAVEDRLSFLSYAPVLKISALTGRGVHRLLPTLSAAVEAYHRRVPTGELNKVLAAAQAAHPSPGGRVLYATQGATDPPTFILFTTKPLAPTYLRYLERRIREHFNFGATPLKLRVRRRSA